MIRFLWEFSLARQQAQYEMARRIHREQMEAELRRAQACRPARSQPDIVDAEWADVPQTLALSAPADEHSRA